MRFHITISFPVAAGNAAIRMGTIGETIQSILEETKPETVYFGVKDGKRTAFVIVNMTNASELPAIFEPWFLAFDARIDATPVMVPEDLAKAGGAFESAVKKFGG